MYHPRRRRKLDALYCCVFANSEATKSSEENVGAHFSDGSEPGAGAEAEEWNESGSSTETEAHGTELFWLDYQADSGTITSFLVHKVNTHPFD